MNYFRSKSYFYEKRPPKGRPLKILITDKNYFLNLTIIFFVYALLSESVTFSR
jgi:hypothetical protein